MGIWKRVSGWGVGEGLLAPKENKVTYDYDPGRTDAVVSGTGVDMTWTVTEGTIEEPKMSSFEMYSEEAMSLYQNIGQQVLKSVDLNTVRIDQPDQSLFQQTVGYAMIVSKLRNAKDALGNPIFDANEVEAAQAVLTNAKIKF